MTKNRWNKMKIGDILENERTRRKYIIIEMDRRYIDGKAVVSSIKLMLWIKATDFKQWRVLTKTESAYEFGQ